MSTATIISQHTHPSFIWRIGPQRLRRGNSLYLLCWSVYLLTSSHPPASLTACPRMKSRGPIGGVTCRNSNYSIRAKPEGHTMPDVLWNLSIIGGGMGPIVQRLQPEVNNFSTLSRGSLYSVIKFVYFKLIHNV